MRYDPPKFSRLSEMAAIDVARLSEDEARTMLEQVRWPEGPVCPHCGENEITRIKAKSKKVRDGLCQCRACHKQFTVTTKTVMHGSHITLRQWVQAFHSMAAHKKGVSALQLQRDLGLKSYKSAWHLAHRIREAMREEPMQGKLDGIVEADETYIGGKSRKKKRGRGSERKTPVIALVERGGRMKARPVADVSGKTLKGAIRESVKRSATIMTDEWPSYRGLHREFRGHKTVDHGRREYVRGNISTNSAESFFALLKRGVHGTFHHVSKKHLHRYCDEFAFRWCYRKVTDGERAEAAIRGAEGKRLSYKMKRG